MGVEGLVNYIREGINFNLANPGAPIAFTARYLGNQQIAVASLITEYSEIASVNADDVERRYEVWDDSTRGGPVDTGIPVANGDRVTITAQPGYTIWSGVWLTGRNGPEGWTGWTAAQDYPVPGEAPFSLVARWGNDEWFFVGTGVEVQRQGETRNLWLGLNDNNPRNGDGYFLVTVRVRRRSAAEMGLNGVGASA